MKWQLLLVGLLLIACVANAGAWQDSLNNGEKLYLTYGATTTLAYNPIDPILYPDTLAVAVYPYSFPWDNYIVTPTNYGTSTYFAYTERGGGHRISFGLFGSDGSVLYAGQNNYAYVPSGTNRVEIVKFGTTVVCYSNGVAFDTQSVPSAAVYGYGVTSGGTPSIDDFSFGNSFTDTGIVSTMPHTFSIVKNFLSPTSAVEKDGSGNTASSSYFNVQWSLGPQADGWTMATAPNSRYRIVISAPSGTQCYNQYVNITATGSASGIISIPFNATYIGTAPFEYGLYNVVLYDGTGIKSTDYFSVVGQGAALSWDQAMYGSGATATITYSITSGYYDPTNYIYSIKIVDIYGDTKDTKTLSSQTGTVTSVLTGYSPGVYYAELMATPTIGGASSMLYYAATEVNAYVAFNGYVMNEETAATLSGANITVSQGNSTYSQFSASTGAWNSSNNWLTGTPITVTTNLSGYANNVRVLTPLAAGEIPFNISMVPTTHTYTGVSIGGIVRDNQYGNPVTSATVNVYNTSTSESYNNVTNIAGYYIVNNLVGNRLYNVSSTKSGYSNSTIAQVVAVGV